MASQLQAAELLRRAADALCSPPTTTHAPMPVVTTCTPTTSSTAHSSSTAPLRSELGRLFAPYPYGGTRRSRGQGRPRYPESRPSYTITWSHRMFCLSSAVQDWVPTRGQKQDLFRAGLGEKKITFNKNDHPQSLRDKLFEFYPQLQSGGGFELLRSNFTNRSGLELIPHPPAGYTSRYLADEAGLGQATCYIRPMQRDIDCTPTPVQSKGEATECCLTCNVEIPVSGLKEHAENCLEMRLSCSDDDDDDSIPPMAPSKKLRPSQKQPSICSYAKKKNHGTGSTNSPVVLTEDEKEEPEKKECPLCFKEYPTKDIESHAAMCTLSSSSACSSTLPRCVPDETSTGLQSASSSKSATGPSTGSWVESVQSLAASCITKPDWGIDLIRADAARTALEELTEASDDNWSGKVLVRFIGESAIDGGGPRREMFTLLFTQSDLFDREFFKVTADNLTNKMYQILGKAVAFALVFGHPGPQRLHPSLAQYILRDTEPADEDISVQDAAVLAVMKQIEECADDESCQAASNACMDELAAAKFSKVLNMKTKAEALVALKQHHGFYQYMAATRQFMAGLELHGVLALMRQHPENAVNVLVKGEVQVEALRQFYTGNLDDPGTERRKLEETVVYNFYRFCTLVSKGRVCKDLYSMETDETKEHTLTMGEVVQVLVGSPSLPLDISSGLIEFDHIRPGLPQFSTCGPAITFRNPKGLQDYKAFEDTFSFAVMGSKNFFGQA